MELQKIYDENKSHVKAFAESRIGGRSENQDSFGWADTDFGYVVTVCDGMGGGPGGKTASSIAVDEILTTMKEAAPDEDPKNVIVKAVRRANMAIIETGRNNPKLRGMGSTATVLLLNEYAAYVAHVGDSRIYQIRGHRKVFRTFDHSMVFEMVEQGIITEEQARLSAQSNVITRALGVKPDVDVEIKEIPYLKGDRFLLCSDGIHGSMPEVELVKMVGNRNMKLAAMVDDIATFVDNLGRTSGGGHDNLTLAVIETEINSKLKPKMTKQVKIVISVLAVILLFSVVLNIRLCGNASDGKVADTTEVKDLKDSITNIYKDVNRIGEYANNRADAKKSLDSIRQIYTKLTDNINKNR